MLCWHQRLQKRGGWLVVDEAFMDATPAFSLCPHAGQPGLIVLRSLGKSFGLAGVRAGFVLADKKVAGSLKQAIGPWPLSGPARYVMRRALMDKGWQCQALQRLRHDSDKLRGLFQGRGFSVLGGSFLFQTICDNRSRALADGFTRCGLLVRIFKQPRMLRFELPGCQRGWETLEAVIQAKFRP